MTNKALDRAAVWLPALSVTAVSNPEERQVMPDEFDPDERFKLDIGAEEPEDALRRLLDKKTEPQADSEDEDA